MVKQQAGGEATSEGLSAPGRPTRVAGGGHRLKETSATSAGFQPSQAGARGHLLCTEPVKRAKRKTCVECKCACAGLEKISGRVSECERVSLWVSECMFVLCV